MACRVEITPEAELDSHVILERLLEQGAGDTGLRWFLKMEEAMARLADFPERCSLAPENVSASFELRHLLYIQTGHGRRTKAAFL